jgi:hypothetical protein
LEGAGVVEKGCDGGVDADLRRRVLEEEEGIGRLLGWRREPIDGRRALVVDAMLDCGGKQEWSLQHLMYR